MLQRSAIRQPVTSQFTNLMCRYYFPAGRAALQFFITAIFLLSKPGGACAQSPDLQFKRINYEQGLSNSTIEAIIQDSRGFIWIGTRDGLNKFDGYRMTTYRNVAGDPGALSDNYISGLFEDSRHTLWVCTPNGLNRFDQRTGAFHAFKNETGDPGSLSNNYVTSVTEDQYGFLWVGTRGGGINILNPKTGKFRHFRHRRLQAGGPGSDYVNAIFKDSRGAIWLGLNSGLSLYNPVSQKFTTFLEGKGNNIKCIAEHTDGRLWLGTEDHGLLLFDPVSRKSEAFRHAEMSRASLGSDMILNVLKDRSGTIWIGTINGGLNRFNAASKTFTSFMNDPADPASLSQRTVSALLSDRQGNLWIGTHRGGLNLYSPLGRKFEIYRQEVGRNSLSYNDVKAFCEDHLGRIWIGTDGGGLNLFDPEKKTFRHYRYDPYKPASLGSDAVLDITEDRNHNLWIGTWGSGLNLMDTQTGAFRRFRSDPSNPASISSDFVQQIYEDRQGRLWVATYFGGLNLFDPVTRSFRRIVSDPAGETKLSGNNVVSINEDRSGNLWIGTDDGGLNCYRARENRFRHYFNNENKKPDIRVVFTDNKGRLWIGQAGLYLYDPLHDRFRLFTSKAGLDREFIKGIVQDQTGNLWISTLNGLVKLNPETLQYSQYNTSDGTQDLEFEANAFMKTRNGELFFGGINGFNICYPEQIRSNRFTPPVYITGLQIFNKEVKPRERGSPLSEDISFTKNIRLSYLQSSIAFTFSALNYIAPDNNRYAYKLEGFEKNWNESTHDRKANYTNLDPGTYTFRLRASNNDGLWNNKGTAVRIEIAPPFWQTWWFRSLMILGAIGAVIGIARHLRSLELKRFDEEKREELHQLQLQLFTNISHEFRTPLTLILGPIEKLLKKDFPESQLKTFRVIYRNAKRLMSLINELMDFRKAESGSLNLKIMPGNLNVFLNEIAEEFSEWSAQKSIRFSVHHTPQSNDSYFDRQILEKIVLNLVSNAFKYTDPGGQIALRLFFSENEFVPSFPNELVVPNDFRANAYFYILVADTGVGISKDSMPHLFQRYYRITSAHLGSGIGLAFVKTLTLLHKGYIKVYSEKNRGTEILIAIPRGRESYSRRDQWVAGENGAAIESIGHDWLVPATDAVADDLEEKYRPLNGRRSVLIADDNPELRAFLKETLQEHYRTIEATDGIDALQKAKETLPNLIISDVMMPAMNGFDFCKQVKDDARTRHIPVILLTARDALESRIEGVQSGADFYFSKPVSMNLLLLTIRNIFLQDEKLKEKYARDYQSEIVEMMDSNIDKEFMNKLVTTIESQLINPELDVEFLCKELYMSHTKLYETVKRLTGQSIIEFIRTIRLNCAMQIMIHENVSLSEVMYRVGIQTQSYFAKAFKKEFGKTPTQLLQELRK